MADPGADLAGLDIASWGELQAEQRDELIKYIDCRFKLYLANLYESADLCVDRYDAFIRRHHTWRYIAIIGMGLLACLNFVAARKGMGDWRGGIIPISAAIAALIVAVLANLETFSNSAERAQAYRESRELFLDAAQEFDRVWSVTVLALGDSAGAYSNAIELYKRIVAADRELRSTFKELTKQGEFSKPSKNA